MISCGSCGGGFRPRQWLSGTQWEVAAQSNNQRRLQYDDARKPAVKNVVVPGPWPQAFAKTFEHVAWLAHAQGRGAPIRTNDPELVNGHCAAPP